MVHHFKEGTHLLALQEVNMCVQEFKELLTRTFPGAALFGYTNGGSNGSVLVVHPSLASFVRPLNSVELGPIGNVHECIAAVTVALPKEPVFHVFSIYISGHDAVARDQVANAITPWFNTPAIFMGDMNHVQNPMFDALHQRSPADWPWLRTQLSASAVGRPTLLDFFRLQRPHDRTLTRPSVPPDGTSKGSRIDYVLGTEDTRPWLASSQVTIHHNQMGSDHRPVELIKPIQPFTPPHDVVNAVLRISEFSDKQLKKFHSILQPIADFASLLPEVVSRQEDQQVVGDAELIFECLEIAARQVTDRGAHIRKLSAKEKELESLINQRSDAVFSDRADQLTKEIVEEAQAKATKRLHGALVRGTGMKKANLNFNNNVSPVSLISKEGEVAGNPAQNCRIMSDTLLKLGGDVNYKVPKRVEESFLQDVKSAPPNKDFPPPTWEQFQSIIRKPKPQKAVGLDSLNLYLLSVCPDSIQHYIFSLVNHLWHTKLPPNGWKRKYSCSEKGGTPWTQPTIVL